MRNISQPREADLRAEQLLREVGCDNPTQAPPATGVSFLRFFRDHSLRSLSACRTRYGQVRLRVKDWAGRESEAYGEDFSHAFDNLKQKFC